MSSVDATVSASALAGRWWALVARGVAAVLFGIFLLAWLGRTLPSLVLLWGTYALADGVFDIVLTPRRRSGAPWGWLVFSAAVSLVTAALAFARTGMTALTLSTLVGIWAVVVGVAEIGAASRLGREVSGEWLLLATGLLSAAFGVLLLVMSGARSLAAGLRTDWTDPSTGAAAVVWIATAWAVATGVLRMALGVHLRRWDRSRERLEPEASGRGSASDPSDGRFTAGGASDGRRAPPPD